jgi:hypothetical protein
VDDENLAALADGNAVMAIGANEVG